MLVRDNYHLSYCTNIHPGEGWEQTWENLRKFLPVIKQKVSPDTPFGVGLRLSNKASEELGTGDKLEALKVWMLENDLYVFTMNGFPYGSFHFKEVKDLVHAPDWTTDDRLDYTFRLIDQLAYLLPRGLSGSISTSPLSYRHWYSSEDFREKCMKKAAKQLAKVVMKLYELERDQGVYIHLDLEPEPDGLMQNSLEVIDFFREYLIPIASEYIEKQIDRMPYDAEEMVLKYINVCYDVCHFSMAYESPQRSFKRFSQTGIRVGKIQISSALKVKLDGRHDQEKMALLAGFDEPTYLHQVTELRGDTVKTYQDLPAVLKSKRSFKELRAHFHVPVFLENYGLLDSTQDHILATLEYLKNNDRVCEHLEVETYTWEVLPDDLKTSVEDCIERELLWVKEKFKCTYEEDGCN
ncbi:xylose isomerase [Robertkochia marina]|uniref:Xylose isomerase n=1 Tax=Robertkochia marina TaxID=1227945 RepID=A0A4S3M132_9FLAO|nr:metabolite traffic protein EboE [Robertkochia marina]THD66673.1 xylose isomerase [Robertkochia marina]TRZ45489.1 xylose isomerase [Robertkochia marina]